MYENYCLDHYANGLCDQGCNTEQCGWDGLDCAGKIPEDLADGVLVLVVLLPPEELLRTSTAFLHKLSAILHTSLRFRLDRNGKAMILPYTRREARFKRELQPQHEVIGSVRQTVNRKPEVSPVNYKLYMILNTCCSVYSGSSKVYLEIDNRLCYQESEDCFPTADSAAEYLGALSASEMLRFPYPLKEARGE